MAQDFKLRYSLAYKFALGCYGKVCLIGSWHLGVQTIDKQVWYSTLTESDCMLYICIECSFIVLQNPYSIVYSSYNTILIAYNYLYHAIVV